MNPIVYNFVPRQRNTQQAVVNPKEYSPTEWSFNANRDPTFNRIYLNSGLQSDNMFHLREPSNDVKTKALNPLTGQEPIYGETRYQLNPLDNNKTNQPVLDLYKVTQIYNTMNINTLIRTNPNDYPDNGGKKYYYNFSASPYYMTGKTKVSP